MVIQENIFLLNQTVHAAVFTWIPNKNRSSARGVNQILYTTKTTCIIGRERFNRNNLLRWVWETMSLPGTREKMVEVVKISKNGKLLQIKEVSDKYRETPYTWNDAE